MSEGYKVAETGLLGVENGKPGLTYHGWYEPTNRPWWAFWRPSHVYREKWVNHSDQAVMIPSDVPHGFR